MKTGQLHYFCRCFECISVGGRSLIMANLAAAPAAGEGAALEGKRSPNRRWLLAPLRENGRSWLAAISGQHITSAIPMTVDTRSAPVINAEPENILETVKPPQDHRAQG